MTAETRRAAAGFLAKNKYLLLVLAAGLVLLLWPGTGAGDGAEDDSGVSTQSEQRLERALSGMDGVGEVRVLLAEEGRSGEFTGAVIICQGATSAQVRLRIVQAVSAFTGLGSDRIIVQKMKD